MRSLAKAAWSRLKAPSDRSVYLAVFRVYIAFHIVKKLAFLWPYLDLLYNPKSPIVWTDKLYGIVEADQLSRFYLEICVCIIGLAVLMAFGIGRRVTIVLLYIAIDLLQHINGYCLNGGDNLLKFLLLYLSCSDCFNYLALRRSSPSPSNHIVNLATNLSVISIIGHLSIIYLISGMAKVSSVVWRNGTALHYILNLTRFSGTRFNSALAEMPIFVYFGTYATMVWEVLFPILILIRRLRVLTLVAGLMMHIGIYVFMMINDFEILFVMIYGFFFSDAELRAFATGVTDRVGRLRGLRALQGNGA